MSGESVFKAICNAFNSTPDACYPDYDPASKMRITDSGDISAKTIAFILIGLVALSVLLLYWYRRYAKREMKEEMELQIGSIMSQYYALSESKEKKPIINPS